MYIYACVHILDLQNAPNDGPCATYIYTFSVSGMLHCATLRTSNLEVQCIHMRIHVYMNVYIHNTYVLGIYIYIYIYIYICPCTCIFIRKYENLDYGSPDAPFARDSTSLQAVLPGFP